MQSIYVTFVQYTYSVVEPEPRFLARAVKKGAASAQVPAPTLCLKKRNKRQINYLK